MSQANIESVFMKHLVTSAARARNDYPMYVPSFREYANHGSIWVKAQNEYEYKCAGSLYIEIVIRVYGCRHVKQSGKASYARGADF